MTNPESQDPAQSAPSLSAPSKIGTRAILAAATLAGAIGSADAGAPKLAFDVIPLFELYDPTYRADRAAARQPLTALAERVHALETRGSPATRCAQERLTELRTTIHVTADFSRARAETEALERLLAAPERETAPDGPDRDGAWGRCYSQWYLRLDTSYDAISEREAALPVPATFLDRVNGTDALLRYLRSIAVSDIAAVGVNHRRELNYAVAALMRLILRDQPIGYPWAPGLKDTMRQWLLGELRDPASGMWGPRCVRGEAIVFVPDLSVTFHVVKYLEGDVPDWPRIIDSLLAMRDLNYPQGWRQGDGYLAHDLYDVATLFRLGWAKADTAQRSRISAALGDMVDWCLAHTVKPDGSVVVDEGDDSIETAAYFAVGLLDELGYFVPAKRFWTARDFPDGPALAAKMAARIREGLAHGGGAEGGTYYRNALRRLAAAGAP